MVDPLTATIVAGPVTAPALLILAAVLTALVVGTLLAVLVAAVLTRFAFDVDDVVQQIRER